MILTGVAHTIDPEHTDRVRAYLGPFVHLLRLHYTRRREPTPNLLNHSISDYREKDGYTIESVDVFGIVNGEEHVVVEKVRF